MWPPWFMGMVKGYCNTAMSVNSSDMQVIAVKYTGLIETLNGKGPITVFVIDSVELPK